MIRLGDNKEKEVVNILKSEYDLLLKSSSEVEQLKVQLAELKRMIFGSKSERFVPLVEGQLGLFSEAVSETPAAEEEQVIEVKGRNHPNQNKSLSEQLFQLISQEWRKLLSLKIKLLILKRLEKKSPRF